MDNVNQWLTQMAPGTLGEGASLSERALEEIIEK